MADHANIAAAVAAGYSETVNDRGASFPNASARFEVTLEKYVTGGGSSGSMQRAFGQGSSQAAAEAVALAALNAQRRHRYGGSPGRASADAVNSPDSRNAAMTIHQT
jgi:hypothetical protein